MAKVRIKHEYEQFETLMRRFKRVVEKDNILKDYAKHEFYEKPTTKRKRAKAAAQKRSKYST